MPKSGLTTEAPNTDKSGPELVLPDPLALNMFTSRNNRMRRTTALFFSLNSSLNLRAPSCLRTTTFSMAAPPYVGKSVVNIDAFSQLELEFREQAPYVIPTADLLRLSYVGDVDISRSVDIARIDIVRDVNIVRVDIVNSADIVRSNIVLDVNTVRRVDIVEDVNIVGRIDASVQGCGAETRAATSAAEGGDEKCSAELKSCSPKALSLQEKKTPRTKASDPSGERSCDFEGCTHRSKDAPQLKKHVATHYPASMFCPGCGKIIAGGVYAFKRHFVSATGKSCLRDMNALGLDVEDSALWKYFNFYYLGEMDDYPISNSHLQKLAGVSP
ncbi:hypothetical protein EW145_g3649 [Phellinidium pouzarii]|uniref:C2H2-type domain-containing protein n=1 Tax=Phellinidium pouzarii TaxID=167371 RepID=A0A4S4L6V8_9AGAM|nr:hypothetical protein EW145_g3649 [Phellinidium pouzarii]